MSPAGLADTRSSNADATSPHGPSLADNTGSILHSQEVYRLEWFSILVVMLLLSFCELIIFVLTVEVNPHFLETHIVGVDAISVLVTAFMAYLIIWSSVTLYTAFFICLTEYHKAVGNNLDRFLFLPRHVQQMSLRVVAYLYGVLSVAGLAASLYVATLGLL